LCPAEIETLGFHLAVEVARCFRDRREGALAPGAEELANGVGASVRAVREILDKLEDKGILSLCSVGGKDEGYRLGRPAERIQISELVVSLRGNRAEIEDELRTPVNKIVDEMIAELDRATGSFSNRSTLADVLAKIPEEVAPDARVTPA
jgi:DNA-binding IscR family transcriptional regulator